MYMNSIYASENVQTHAMLALAMGLSRAPPLRLSNPTAIRDESRHTKVTAGARTNGMRGRMSLGMRISATHWGVRRPVPLGLWRHPGHGGILPITRSRPRSK